MSFLRTTIFIFCCVVAFTSCDRAQKRPVKLSYDVIAAYPHDARAYTQGLAFAGRRFLESTGQYGESTVREVELKTGEVLKKRAFPARIFAEGITMHNGELWLLTWKEKTAYVLDATSFAMLREFPYDGEGWGLASDGKNLIMSDGSSTLKFINPVDFAVVKSISVINDGRPLAGLNELEFYNGKLYANVYLTEQIVEINPSNGNVTGTLDCSGLRSKLPAAPRAEVLNGIAHDPATGHFLVTGKYWPQVFELKLSEAK